MDHISASMNTDHDSISLAVMRLEENRRLAMLQSDTAALNDLLGDSLVYLHSNGGRDTKISLIEKISQSHIRYETLELNVTRIQHTSRFALINGSMKARVRLPDQVVDVQSQYEAVWMRHEGRWSLSALQSYR